MLPLSDVNGRGESPWVLPQNASLDTDIEVWDTGLQWTDGLPWDRVAAPSVRVIAIVRLCSVERDG